MTQRAAVFLEQTAVHLELPGTSAQVNASSAASQVNRPTVRHCASPNAYRRKHHKVTGGILTRSDLLAASSSSSSSVTKLKSLIEAGEITHREGESSSPSTTFG